MMKTWNFTLQQMKVPSKHFTNVDSIIIQRYLPSHLVFHNLATGVLNWFLLEFRRQVTINKQRQHFYVYSFLRIIDLLLFDYYYGRFTKIVLHLVVLWDFMKNSVQDLCESALCDRASNTTHGEKVHYISSYEIYHFIVLPTLKNEEALVVYKQWVFVILMF